MSYVIRRKNSTSVCHTDPATGHRNISTTVNYLGAGLTVADIVERMIEARRPSPAWAATTRSVSRCSITPFFGDRHATAITAAGVREWLAWLDRDRGLAASTILMHFRILNAACDHAVELGLLQINPCAGIRPVPGERRIRPERTGPRVRSGSTGAAAGHSRASTPMSRLAAAIDDDAVDLRPLFLPAVVD
jgi:hypothetical protein